ncbi:MAG: class I SAM-dependent methyltransferase [Gammaproteobacteria bacterium]
MAPKPDAADYATVQAAAFGRLVRDGTYHADFAHAPAPQRLFVRTFTGLLTKFSGRETLSVIDCGCGSGAWLELAIQCCREHRFNVVPFGFDITPEMVSVAEQRLAPLNAQLQTGDVLNAKSYEFLGAPVQFDIVFTYDVVQQLPRDLQYEACRTLLARVAPGGVLVVFDHDCDSRHGRKMAMRKFITRYFGIPLVPRYYCNARYPPMNRFAARLRRETGAITEIHVSPETPKLALTVYPQ